MSSSARRLGKRRQRDSECKKDGKSGRNACRRPPAASGRGRERDAGHQRRREERCKRSKKRGSDCVPMMQRMPGNKGGEGSERMCRMVRSVVARERERERSGGDTGRRGGDERTQEEAKCFSASDLSLVTRFLSLPLVQCLALILCLSGALSASVGPSFSFPALILSLAILPPLLLLLSSRRQQVPVLTACFVCVCGTCPLATAPRSP